MSQNCPVTPYGQTQVNEPVRGRQVPPLRHE